jgi:hypothetical protein
MTEFWQAAVPLLALFGSIILAIALLARQRSRVEPPEEDGSKPQVPASASRRTRKIAAKLSPLPEIPTVMDMVKAEVAELGLEDISGHEDLPGPVLLKVYRRDLREGCDHDTLEYRTTEGVERAEATEDDVILRCTSCTDEGTNAEE